MSTLVLLDLDRTAFKTDLHFSDFCSLIAEEFGISADQLKEREHKLTKKPGPYSPIDDIRYNESINVDSNEVLTVVSKKLQDKATNYLFDDVLDFFEWSKQKGNPIVLITVGTHEYQTHKQQLIRDLSDLPIIITRDTKANELKNRLNFIEGDGVLLTGDDFSIKADRAMLIDDRSGTFADTDVMPSDKRLELIRIRRKGVEYYEDPTPKGIREIEKLTDLIK